METELLAAPIIVEQFKEIVDAKLRVLEAQINQTILDFEQEYGVGILAKTPTEPDILYCKQRVRFIQTIDVTPFYNIAIKKMGLDPELYRPLEV